MKIFVLEQRDRLNNQQLVDWIPHWSTRASVRVDPHHLDLLFLILKVFWDLFFSWVICC